MVAITSLTKASATLTQLNSQNPQRFQAATLVEIAEIARQQAVTNELLHFNAEVACENNSLLRGIREAVESFAISEHRERLLKELLYQMTKLLKADQIGKLDPVELAFRARLFLGTVGEHQFSTADLSDLREKTLFDNLLVRARNCTETPERKELEEFEAVYAMYQGAREEDLAANVPLPELPLLALPKKPEMGKLDDIEPLESFDSHLNMLTVFSSVGLLACGYAVFRCVMAFHTNITYASIAILLFGSGLCWSIVTLIHVYSLRTNPLKHKEARTAHEQKRREWEIKKKEWDEKKAQEMDSYTKKVNQVKVARQKAHDKAMSRREEQVQQARQHHQALLDKMHGIINDFLDNHPGLQEFLPKVSRARVK